MLPAGLESPRQVIEYYDARYFEWINTGQANRFIYPQASFSVFFILLYLLIDHRGSRILSSSRYVVFALFSVSQAWCLFTNKARNPAAAFGVGLISAFSWLWVAVHMVVNDCQTDYRMIARKNGTLHWQPYPDKLLDRLYWILSLFISFRGVGWNWQTDGVPDAPSWVAVLLNNKTSYTAEETQVKVSRIGLRRFSDRRALLIDTAIKAALGYIALDALKTFVMNDAYFWGYTNAPAPAWYPQVIQESHILTNSIRLVTTMTCTYTALWTIFKLGPLFFAGILGPQSVGILGEAWMNPADMFGSFKNVLDKGLAGFWGGYWHQVFRFAFEAPATRLLNALKIDKKSQAGQMVALVVAFTLSGILHACGSYTQTGDTRPLRGPLAFFMLQALGIALERLMWTALKTAGVDLPQPVKRVINFTYALLWLYHTGPLMSDDFSQGGVWLFEPVPLSIFRGLGFGPAGTGWLCWGSDFASWHHGKSWYDTGLCL